MQLKKPAWAAMVLVMAASLASCNIGVPAPPSQDVSAIYTTAAGTMIAQLNVQQTQTAQAVPPTPLASPTALATFTPLPTFPLGPGITPFGTPLVLNTPLGGLTPLASLPPGAISFPVGCNDATLVGETIPDGTKMEPGKEFEKAWSFVNTGTCAWDEGYAFAFKSGDQLQGVDFRFVFEKDFVKPGKGIAFIIGMTAPGHQKEYKGYWQMKNDSGQWFGSLVWVDIVVKKP